MDESPGLMALREGSVVRGWTLVDRVAEGGTATVWRVKSGDQRAVLKVLRAELRGEADWRARLMREADALRTVKHDNVVALIDAGTTEGDEPFVVMPEIEGETLRARLARDEKLDAREAWRLLRPVAEALAAAHQAGVVHRDVKPDNIVVGPSGDVKLVDFGLARPHVDGADVPKVTATGAPIGTPTYMAPEQWWNKAVGPAVDQYALGVTLFEAIAGAPPFSDASYAELVSSHVSKPAPRLEGQDDRVTTFVARLLEKEPSARFTSMRDAIDAGDEAFGARASRWRPSIASIFFAAYGATALVLFGYPRATTFAEWFRGAGWGIFVTYALFAAGAAWISFRANARGWIALVVAASGTFGALTGFQKVFETIATFAPESAFTLFHEGAWEAQTNRYVGFTLASSLLYAAEVRRTKPPTTKKRAASMATLACAAAFVTLGFPSAAIVLAALAFVFVLPETIATLVGLAFAAVAAVTRAQALCDAAWSLEPTRAARAAALVVAFHERTLTFVVAGAALGAALVVTRRAWTALGMARSRAWLAFGVVFALGDAALTVRTILAKGAIYTHLAPEFALFSRLDPPTASARGDSRVPPVRPTLKIARDRVALDDTPALVLAALDSDAGLAVLRSDLSHRIARDAAGTDTKTVELLVMADAQVEPRVVTACLRAAYDIGVRRVGVLLLRGAPLPASAALPDEAFYALPGDFSMITITLADGGAPLHGKTFDDATHALLDGDVIDVR